MVPAHIPISGLLRTWRQHDWIADLGVVIISEWIDTTVLRLNGHIHKMRRAPTWNQAPMIKPGIYRRAFDWRISRADKESIPNIAAAFVGLSSDDYTDILEDYLTVTRKRKNNRTALAKVQLHLVEELMVAQAAIKHYREKLEELKAQLATAQPTEEKVKEDIRFVERELFFHRAHAN